MVSIYDFGGCIENWPGNYFCFFPTDAGDFTCLAGFFPLMWEILHACRESGRNSVQAGDSLSMRESWKPCAYSRVIQFICPNLNCKIEDIGGLTTSLGDGPFIDLALSSYTCKLYHNYGHLLAPIEAAIITSGYLSKATPVQPEALVQSADTEALVQSADLQSEAPPQPEDE